MSRFKLEWKSRKLTLRNVFTISRSSRSHVENIFVHLSADGFTGYGEASPNSRYDEYPESVVAYLESLPDDFFDDIEQAETLTTRLDDHKGHKPVQSAKAAIEMAWLDWWGKSQGQPVWRLWGHDSPVGPITSYTIGIDSPEKMQQKIREASQYPVYKIKLGTDHDRELIAAIREVTDKPIRVDANEGWTSIDQPIRVDANEGWTSIDQAKKEIAYLADQNVELIEQPMPAAMLDEMKQLKSWSPIQLCADESFEGDEKLEDLSQAFDVLNIKLMKIGSVVKARQVIQQARQLGLHIMIGCMIESSLANAAGALVALEAQYADLDGHLLIGNDPFSGLNLNEDKNVVLSDAPGLGMRFV